MFSNYSITRRFNNIKKAHDWTRPRASSIHVQFSQCMSQRTTLNVSTDLPIDHSTRDSSHKTSMRGLHAQSIVATYILLQYE